MSRASGPAGRKTSDSDDNDEDAPRGPENFIGQVLANRYLIEHRLGEGAMGSVFKAKHVKVGRAFAVKVLHKKLVEDRKVLLRFEREAELAGRLRNPNVVGVVDVGETPDGYRYMVMDFAEGQDLATLLGEAPMPAERIVHLVRQLLEGLYHAHEQGLIHRDFKPENVIVERDDHDTEVPRIVDFGIAILREGGDSTDGEGRLTTNGLVLGTPHYMAPEQAVADPIDHRIDLFALGIVIYEMLCGKLPFDGTGAEVARANLLLDPPLIAQRVPYLEVDPLLEAFARKLMAKKRDHRPATAKAARELLDLIANDRPAAAQVLGVPLAQSSRQPATTQPVSPQRVRDEGTGDYAPVVPPEIVVTVPTGAMGTAATLEAPAVHSAFVVAPLRAERFIPTEDALPLVRKRRTWMIAGIGMALAAAILTVIAVKAMTHKDAAPVDSGIKVVMPVTPPANDPPPVAPTTNDTKPTVDTPAKDPPATTDTKPDPKPEKKPEKKPKVIAKLDPKPKPPTQAKPVVKPDPKVKTEPVATPEPAAMTATSLRALHGTVGAELKQARLAHGDAAVATVEAKFTRINILDATSTQSKIDAVATDLKRMRAELAALKK